MHVHVAGRGDVWPDDLWWSKKFEGGFAFKSLAVLKGWSCRPVGDRLMVDALMEQAAKARRIDYAVVLAFDNFVVDLCGSNPKLLPTTTF